MATRKIRELGDEVLTKQCKEVTKMTLRTKILIQDMLDTMYEALGVGLAAPQVGVLKRIIVIDVGEGPIVLINPEILETSGEQTGEEGCLSVPGKSGQVTRPDYVKVRALNEDMEEIELEGTGLLARAFCHEIDHLDGKMYVDLVEGGDPGGPDPGGARGGAGRDPARQAKGKRREGAVYTGKGEGSGTRHPGLSAREGEGEELCGGAGPLWGGRDGSHCLRTDPP